MKRIIGCQNRFGLFALDLCKSCVEIARPARLYRNKPDSQSRSGNLKRFSKCSPDGRIVDDTEVWRFSLLRIGESQPDSVRGRCHAQSRNRLALSHAIPRRTGRML
jgi:hypothetical protein